MSSKQEERSQWETPHCHSRDGSRGCRQRGRGHLIGHCPLTLRVHANQAEELIHLTTWMSGAELETQFGSKLESDVTVIKWEKWMCCGQDLVNNGCKSCKYREDCDIADGVRRGCGPASRDHALMNLNWWDANEPQKALTAPTPVILRVCPHLILLVSGQGHQHTLI